MNRVFLFLLIFLNFNLYSKCESLFKNFNFFSKLTNDAYDYWADAYQRNIIFLDILRKRGNLYLKHLIDGQPPVLSFKYKMVLNGEHLPKPVNYSLIRIIEENENKINPMARPIIIIDPRAGHGPGIGGTKKDSEVGISIEQGHPVYFVVFTTEPLEGQTILDIQKAEIEFIKKVKELHPDSEEPVLIGNCQGGWASALIAADQPDLVGPMIINGAPLSYAAGKNGVYPMRYAGGLLGGVWIASFLSDLNLGKFDGVNLVTNFENSNPANTLWSKQYRVYSNVDSEEERFLEFEKWWNGFFIMTKEEIHFIINDLFIGNKLEKGELELNGTKINLKNIKKPIVVFASHGDNITPPQQALNWIPKTWKSTKELQESNRTIIYLLNEKVGHLGIFVSGQVAKKEHQSIIENLDLIEFLPPGLYEMIITPSQKTHHAFDINYEKREMEDILQLDDGLGDEKAFEAVNNLSQLNDSYYNIFISPWVKIFSNPLTAEILKQSHPLRSTKYIFASTVNPFMVQIEEISSSIKKNRQPLDKESNIFWKYQEINSEIIVSILDSYQKSIEATQELMFKTIYDNPWTTFWSSFFKPTKTLDDISISNSSDNKSNLDNIFAESSLEEGLIRIALLFLMEKNTISSSFIEGFKEIISEIITDISVLKTTLKNQSHLIISDKERALSQLINIFETREARVRALDVIQKMDLLDPNNKSRLFLIEKLMKDNDFL